MAEKRALKIPKRRSVSPNRAFCARTGDAHQQRYLRRAGHLLPTALEQQIVSGVLSGSEAQVASAFEILCQENFTLRRITDMKSRLLVERLAMTISAPLLRMTSLPDEIKLNTLRAIRPFRESPAI